MRLTIIIAALLGSIITANADEAKQCTIIIDTGDTLRQPTRLMIFNCVFDDGEEHLKITDSYDGNVVTIVSPKDTSVHKR